jgi:CheY-like chemotaxis protein
VSTEEHGLRLLHERAPDIVLLDIEMPILDGPGMVTRILVHDAGLEEIPVVLLSGSPELTRVAREVGTPYFLGKPYTYERLMDLVGQALRERAPPAPPKRVRD